MTFDPGAFFGVDRSTGAGLGGYYLAGAAVITPEIIDKAARVILTAPAPAPCGTKGRPHLVHPRPSGTRTQCVECGWSGEMP